MIDMDSKDKEIIDNQIEIAVNRYGFNMPKGLAKSKARAIVKDAMRTYDGTTSLSTYMASKLRKLSRDSYARNYMVKVPEQRIIDKKKVFDFMDEYKDTYGKDASHRDISKSLGMKESSIKHIVEMKNIHNGGDFEIQRNQGLRTDIGIDVAIKKLPKHLRGMASDIYKKNKTSSEIMKSRNVGKTSYFKYKKQIKNGLSSATERNDIDYN